MKPKNLPKLKFKMLNRQLIETDLPLDLSIDKSIQMKPSLFKPYTDCNSSYILKSHQTKSALLSNQIMINELMSKSLFEPFSSPFMYKLSSSLCLATSTNYYSSPLLDLSPLGTVSNLLNTNLERSSSYSPTSTVSTSTNHSSINSTSSFDFNYKPLECKEQQKPIDLTTSDTSQKNIKVVRTKKVRQMRENPKLMKNSTNQNQILIKCPSCWQLFDQENSLRKHIKSKHQTNDGSVTFDRIHRCEHCVLAFTRFDMLQRHNRKHTGDKPYECPICFQNFSRSDHLNTHRINHFGLKMYNCSNCTYKSSRRDMVSRHLQTHSNDGDSNAYVKTDLFVKQLCKKLVHSTPDQIPELLNRFKLES